MRQSTTLSIFPDVNVWLALNYPIHQHHPSARTWFNVLDPNAKFYFCRHTQLGLFRLLTNAAVMAADIKTQRQCWEICDRWVIPGKAFLITEPRSLDSVLRAMTSGDVSSTKVWADAYLAAFAQAANLTLVTFDRALASKAKGSILLN